MSVVKIFDQTVPYVSGYSMRSFYIMDSLVRSGIDIDAFSSPVFSYDTDKECRRGVNYYSSACERVLYCRIYQGEYSAELE
jgi:hypothetical protein